MINYLNPDGKWYLILESYDDLWPAEGVKIDYLPERTDGSKPEIDMEWRFQLGPVASKDAAVQLARAILYWDHDIKNKATHLKFNTADKTDWRYPFDERIVKALAPDWDGL